MLPLKNERRISLNNEFVKTFVLLTLAFVFMTIINVYAYFTIINMSERYTTLAGAAVNIKLKATNANLIFREVIGGYSDKDMNVVWDILNSARKNCLSLRQIGESGTLEGKLNVYREAMLKFYTFPEEKMTPEKRKLKEDFDTAYTDLIGAVDRIERGLNEMVDSKLSLFKILYAILIINILGLFGFVSYQIRTFVTGRLDMEKALEDSRNNITTILNSINTILIFADSEEKVAQWNKSAEKYFSMTSEKAVGQNIWELLDFLKPYHTEYEKIFQLQRSTEFPKEHLSINGSERFLNIKMSYAPGINGVVICLDDITGIEMKERQMRQAQKMQIVENLMSGLSNDFNNALGAITGTITMMKYSLENNAGNLDEIKNNMEIIESSAEKAVVMVQQLLTFAQKHEICLGNIDLNGIVQHILKICQNTADKRIELVGEIYNVRAMTKADPALIEQVLLNLCDNAIQAMTVMKPEAEQGGTLTLSVDKIYPDKNYRALHPQAIGQAYWIISVSDTGVGIDPETLQKIYDPFFTTKSAMQATGLGLTIANEVIRQHNGFIEVESRQGIGSRFSIYLPEFVVQEEAAAAEPEALAEDQIPDGTGLILVADDELIMRKTASSILTKLGYEIVFAEDGEQTVNVYKEKGAQIKAVLLDMAMPKMSGREAYIEMKKINPDVKVLLVSGFKKDKRIEDVLAMGVNAFIQKPYSMITLAQEVKKVISG
ncbi:MAG TPA: hypothetical protein DCZ94_03310 [Lentisphaeria bacterium]|nr:MAG: hypothetical protein A2X48_03975 [Lentisphaerae bacterium GWF2_49_21]HBC85963.1 hypothetical protein [Lentisphaeria bacterium]